jgi:hypothetical protein
LFFPAFSEWALYGVKPLVKALAQAMPSHQRDLVKKTIAPHFFKLEMGVRILAVGLIGGALLVGGLASLSVKT